SRAAPETSPRPGRSRRSCRSRRGRGSESWRAASSHIRASGSSPHKRIAWRKFKLSKAEVVVRSFGGVFIAVVIAAAIVVAAFILNSRRPRVETEQPEPANIRASGKCAECHSRETPAIVHEFEMSRHAAAGVTCLDCHNAGDKQEKLDHRGFVIAKGLTAANCARCHATQYRQFLRSRHAAPSWAAVSGPRDFTPEQIAFAEQYHPGSVNRAATAITGGCSKCHNVGKPNADGSIGSCTNCHARHSASVALARLPETCGQC